MRQTGSGYISIGTPFLDDKSIATEVRAKDKNKYLPAHKQDVRDEHGRRRLHGAFTGGFSAGYFNTVGSKEGWQPSQFKSSRGQRATHQQRAEDFMDEEDLMELGYNEIKTSDQFDILGATERELKQKQLLTKSINQENSHALLNQTLVDNLIVPSSDPVGIKLLKQMGWRDGQGIGPRRKRRRFTEDGSEDIHASQHLFAPKDQSFQIFTAKVGMRGLGFVSTSGHKTVSEKKDSANSNGFGIGVFEDDDDVDVYDEKGSSSRFQSVIPDSFASTAHDQRTLTVGSANQIRFIPASKVFASLQKFNPPNPPPDYKPSNPLKDRPPASLSQSYSLTPDMRRDLLGEEKINAPERSVFSYISVSNQSRLLEFAEKAKEKISQKSKPEDESFLPVVESHVAEAALKGFMPFGNNESKQKRYKRFLMWKAGQVPDKDQAPDGMSAHDQHHELLEFSKAALIFQPLASVMASRFTSAKEGNELPGGTPIITKEWRPVRTVLQWRPFRLVCKRFQVPQPHVTDVKDENASRSSVKEPLNDVDLLELTQSEITRESAQNGNDGNNRHDADAHDQLNDEADLLPRPEMDVFKAIFADDEGDESDNALETVEETTESVENPIVKEPGTNSFFFSTSSSSIQEQQKKSEVDTNEDPVLFKPVFKRKEERVTKTKTSQATSSSESKSAQSTSMAKKRTFKLTLDDEEEDAGASLVLSSSTKSNKKKKMKVRKVDEDTIDDTERTRPSAADFM